MWFQKALFRNIIGHSLKKILAMSKRSENSMEHNPKHSACSKIQVGYAAGFTVIYRG